MIWASAIRRSGIRCSAGWLSLDPELGRFISLDPRSGSPESPQSLDRYVYCANNPLRLVDPTGKGPEILWAYYMIAGVVGAISGAISYITVVDTTNAEFSWVSLFLSIEEGANSAIFAAYAPFSDSGYFAAFMLSLAISFSAYTSAMLAKLYLDEIHGQYGVHEVSRDLLSMILARALVIYAPWAKEAAKELLGPWLNIAIKNTIDWGMAQLKGIDVHKDIVEPVLQWLNDLNKFFEDRSSDAIEAYGLWHSNIGWEHAHAIPCMYVYV